MLTSGLSYNDSLLKVTVVHQSEYSEWFVVGREIVKIDQNDVQSKLNNGDVMLNTSLRLSWIKSLKF